jgi:hypothetical protein
LLVAGKLDFVHVIALVALVNAVVIVVPQDGRVRVLFAVVICIVDSLGVGLGFGDLKYANPNECVAEITPTVPHDFDIVSPGGYLLMLVRASST